MCRLTSRAEAAIDANAPLQDDLDINAGPVDSDEEKDAVMAAIARSRCQPLEQRIFVPTRRKYQFVRFKEMLSNALGGSRGGGLFSTGEYSGRSVLTGGEAGSNNVFASPVTTSAVDVGGGGMESSSRRSSLMHQAQKSGMLSGQVLPSKKPSVSSATSQS
ncbi:MAG: hypothetical protein M1812_001316 [Candelaria pacifica]|nr:MAG: hypothetical protein M1812_001316 [Candelaria pacifica]